MAIIPTILIFFIIASLFVIFIIQALVKGVSGIKLMLLGISIILFGGILALDNNTNIGGIEYVIALVGLIFSIVGFGKKDWL